MNRHSGACRLFTSPSWIQDVHGTDRPPERLYRAVSDSGRRHHRTGGREDGGFGPRGGGPGFRPSGSTTAPPSAGAARQRSGASISTAIAPPWSGSGHRLPSWLPPPQERAKQLESLHKFGEQPWTVEAGLSIQQGRRDGEVAMIPQRRQWRGGAPRPGLRRPRPARHRRRGRSAAWPPSRGRTGAGSAHGHARMVMPPGGCGRRPSDDDLADRHAAARAGSARELEALEAVQRLLDALPV